MHAQNKSEISNLYIGNFRLVFQVNFVSLKVMNLSDITSRKFPIYKLEISDLFCACILARIRVAYNLSDKTSRKFPICKLEISDLFSGQFCPTKRDEFV